MGSHLTRAKMFSFSASIAGLGCYMGSTIVDGPNFSAQVKGL